MFLAIDIPLNMTRQLRRQRLQGRRCWLAALQESACEHRLANPTLDAKPRFQL